MTSLNNPTDSDAAVVAALKDEGAFLLAAERAAETLARRIAGTHPNVKTFHLSRDEFEHLVGQLQRAVAIGKEYHIDASGLAA